MGTCLSTTEAPATRRNALTLMELMVVVGIIVLVMGLAVPALSVWESRKVQEAINLTSSLLRRAQTKAVSEHSMLGLFFYIEPETGAQYIWPIEPAPDNKSPDPTSPRLTADRFVLRDVEPFMLPKPMRVVPASVLEEVFPVHLLWTPEQLVDDNLRDPPDDSLFPETPNNNLSSGPELSIVNCIGGEVNQLDHIDPGLLHQLTGRVHFGGDGSLGYQPCGLPCYGQPWPEDSTPGTLASSCAPLPVRNSTWGLIKALYTSESPN